MSESLSAYARQFLELMQKPDVDHIEGLSPAISIEQKTTSKQSALDRRHGHRDLRLSAPACLRASACPIRPRPAFPIESQTVSQMADRVLALEEGTRLFLLAPIVRGRKGEYRKEFAGASEEGLPARQGRREVLRDRRDARARQETQARHRSGGGPHRGEEGHRQPPARFHRDGAEPRRRSGDRANSPTKRKRTDAEADDDVVEIRLPGFRLHDSGDRAAAVLVQQSAWRLPRLRRARHAALFRSGADRARRNC